MIEKAIQERKKILKPIVVVIATIFFAWILIINSWCSDDSFISMRVVDNFLNGYGLVWNVGERVQVFTHPLWVLILIPVYKVIQDPYLTIYLVSFGISITAYALLIRKFVASPIKIVFGTIILTLSAAFIDYSSSGLENPLTHLLLILFMVIWFNSKDTRGKIFWLYLIAGFATITRYDTILFFIPVLVFIIYENRKKIIPTIAVALLGFLPVIIWELFSLVYYGFLFPNTFYAKLYSTNLPPNWVVYHGWEYFKNSILSDPVTLGMVCLGIVFMIIKPEKKKILMNFGVILYLVYVFYIGGDFMSGRFFSSAFLTMFAIVISYNFEELFPRKTNMIMIGLVSFFVIIGLFSKHPPLLITRNDSEIIVSESGIANEKLFYFEWTSWLNRRSGLPVHGWAKQGRTYRDSGETFTVHNAIGFFGYSAGPNLYILDEYTLSDPLRARISPIEPFRIGHLLRPIPEGYMDTIKDSYTNHISDPGLHEYYDKLDILIHQDLFAPGRLQEILKFNFGKYDYLLEDYSKNL